MERAPKWIREFDCFSKIKSCIVIEGNIYDKYPVLDENTECEDFCTLDEYVNNYFSSDGYKVCFFDLVNGFYNQHNPQDVLDVFELVAEAYGDAAPSKDGGDSGNQAESLPEQYRKYQADMDNPRMDGQIGNSITLELLKSGELIKTMLIENDVPSLFCINFASRILTDPSRMIELERGFFSNLMYATLHTRSNYSKNEGRSRRNMLILITDKVNDIPTWFYLENPCVKSVMIAKPDKKVRKLYMDFMGQYFLKTPGDSTEMDKGLQKQFVEMTEGMNILDLEGIRELKQIQQVPFEKIAEVVSLYKYGIKENPWDDVEREKLDAEIIKRRVKGQDVAVDKALAVVKRAKTGLSGLQHSSNSKPKGILFFAGPTGTGKTELAKTLAEMLFGDESACRRFDMSEYAESHSSQKLFGAPPGYVGYEAGGQLTNVIKEHPFSLLLFDEIEKASPSIWDKFLQILEDGRMTDGQGNTVYFSETIIVFTSNLGIYEDDYSEGFYKKKRVVKKDDPYEVVYAKVEEGIRKYFNDKGKPEVLNRIGRNLVVFNFIQPDAAKEIMLNQMAKIQKNLRETKNINITYADKNVYLKLLEKVNGNLEEGGRGVGNVIEQFFITPLSTYIFNNNIQQDGIITIKDITGLDKSSDGTEIPELVAIWRPENA
ncbi:MAG: AAA family ATPase [Lachnospiraceae bacterium]|nr:AAA family ATPase [Lachnospiraceae bacterium]